MKTLLRRISLECYRHPDDTEKMPWYAWPLALLFVAGWLGADLILSASRF